MYPFLFSRRILGRGGLFLLSMALLFLFQNCGSGFQVQETLSKDALSSQNTNSNNSDLKIINFDKGYGLCHLTEKGEPVCDQGRKKISGLSGFKQFASSLAVSTFCGINADNFLVCGRLDQNFQLIGNPVISSQWGAISKMTGHIMPYCATGINGKVFCTPGYPNLDFVEFPNLEGARDIALFTGGICFIDRDEVLRCGSLSAATSTQYMPLNSKKYRSVVSHESMVCAIDSAGKVDCFNSRADSNVYTPIEMPLLTKPIIKVEISYSRYSNASVPYAFCVIDQDHDLYCWGENQNFIADPTSLEIKVPSPRKISMGKVDDLILRGETQACARLLDKTVKCWSRRNSDGSLFSTQLFEDPAFAGIKQFFSLYDGVMGPDAYLVNSTGQVHCLRSVRWDIGWRIDRKIEPCSGGETPGFIPFGNFGPVKKYIGKRLDSVWSCVLRVDGKVTCWGDSSTHNIYSSFVALGHRAASTQTPYGEIQGLSNVVALEELYGGVCALQAQGNIYCWGHLPNLSGSGASLSTKNLVQLPLNLSVTMFKVLYSYDNAIDLIYQTQDGSLYHFVQSLEGRIHIKISQDLKLTQIASGLAGNALNFCGLDENKKLYCWGWNAQSKQYESRKLVLSQVENIAESSTHWCARTTDKKVSCYGQNTYGQLGRGHTDPVAELSVSPFLADSDEVNVWENTTCVKKSGATKCVGLKSFRAPGSLGDVFWSLFD